MPDTETGAPPRARLVVAAVLVVVLAAGVAVIGLMMRDSGDGDGPLALVPVDAPQVGSAECAQLIPALPAQLDSKGTALQRRTIAEPAPEATVAWGSPESIVLRCGLGKPPELTPTSQLRVVSGVQWLPVEGPGSSTWYVVDRPVYVALTVPDSAGTGPLQQISDTVAATLPAVPLRF
ncbi:DUF3515 domain-containing protein [Amycolatopsis thermoflava]|uniref:Uncharacterized protein DUF3515 n=1 Tax=Amycolatopsis thermoflava TaxID=84480 RepID=A0A3N2GSK1_9PSEU|nr:DUF3515 domain-containing protein [Amycolatopsis thermoflava]ROS39577.1 uncharacterized protein DUF3515 [Amycolatopsis thermoflava]